MSTEFAWPDRVDQQIADHERRIKALEQQTAVLAEIVRDIRDLLKGMRDAVEEPQ